MEKIKILFVCLGNICRSPAAEASFQLLIEQNGLSDKFEIDSAGTGSWHIGDLPDSRMRKMALSKGIEMKHKARQIKKKDLTYYDLILAMDTQNYYDITRIANNQVEKKKIMMFRKFDDSVEGEADVPDPYYGGIQNFENVWNIVSRTNKGLLEWIKQNFPEYFRN